MDEILCKRNVGRHLAFSERNFRGNASLSLFPVKGEPLDMHPAHGCPVDQEVNACDQTGDHSRDDSRSNERG